MSASSSTTSTRTSGIGRGLGSRRALPRRAIGGRRHALGLEVGLERKRDHERRSATRRRLGPDPAAVILDDATADVEPQSHAGVGDASRVRRTVEALEDPLALAAGDPGTMVDHGDPRLASFMPDPESGRLVIGAVLVRVLEEVLDDLLDPWTVDRHHESLVRFLEDERHAVL